MSGIGGFNPATNQFVSAGKYGGMVAESAAHIATYTSDPISNPGAVGLRVDVDISAVVSTPSTTFKIQKWNRAANTWADVIVSAAKTGVTSFSLTVSPSVLAAANVVAQVEAPGTFRVVATHGNANSMTYAIAYEYLMSQLLAA